MNRTIYLTALMSVTLVAAWTTPAWSAALGVPESDLDSRTVSHPEWVQVSGEVQQTMTVRPDGEHARMVAMLQPAEGGHILVDLGPAANLESIKLHSNEHIHVRGTPLQQGESVLIVAGELIADGKVIPIERAEKPESPASGASGQSNNTVHPREDAPVSPAAPSR